MPKINNINAPYQFEEFWSKYPQGYTIYEAILDWLKAVNSMIDVLNLTQEQIDKLFTDTLPENVEAVLTTWYNNGMLADLINTEFLGEIDTKVNTVIAEVNTARGGESNLNARLVGLDNAIIESQALSGSQYSLHTDKMISNINVRGMYVRKASDNTIRVGVGMNATNAVIEYRFSLNGDNQLFLRGVLNGKENMGAKPVISTTGTFVTSTSGQHYTTVVGSKLNFTFKGKKLYFKFWSETRGGLWKITLNNGEFKNVSCYNATGAYKEVLVFNDLDPNLSYVAEAEFMGDDPNNTPSSSPSRGYFFRTADGDQPFKPGDVLPINEVTAKYIVSESSIPDFAIQARKAGSSAAFTWAPVHGSDTNVTFSPAVKLIIDGVVLTETVGVVPEIEWKEINYFTLSQFARYRNANDTASGDLWEHVCTHVLSKDKPWMTIQNSMKLLQNLEWGLGYFGMLPGKTENLQSLKLNNGVSIEPLPISGSVEFNSDITSASLLGEFAAGDIHGISMDISSRVEAYNLGKSYEPTRKLLITYSPVLTKVYFTSFLTGTAPAGTELRCENRLVCVGGINFPNNKIGL